MGISGKFKMILGNSPIKLDAYLYYSSFKGSENNLIIQNTAVDFNTSTSLWTFGIGAEYYFMQKSFSPYAGIDIQFNNQNDLNFERVSPGLNLLYSPNLTISK
jgi:predicted porin